MRSPSLRRLATPIASLLAVLVATLFFHRVGELPLPHGDERGFLNVPYRFATFGDLDFPVFMSESFGAEELRPYPPITALALRSAVVKAVGFSAANSRYVSGALILVVLLAAGLWFRSRFDLSPSLVALVLAPAALAPVVVIAARSTRLEQETFFFGACSTLLLAGGPRGLARSATGLLLAGGLAGLAAGMHPFGVVYGSLAAITLVLVRRPKDLMTWLAGAMVGAAPTVWWMAQKGQSLIAFAAANGAMYQAREKDLSAWLAQFASVSWLKGLGLSESSLARIAAVQHGAFTDYLGFPVEPGTFSLVLRILFWMEVAFLAWFLSSHLRSRRAENDGVALLALLALGFLAFTFSYVPNTTYGLYGGFHVHLAFAAAFLVEAEQAPAWRRLLLVSVVLAYLSFGLHSAYRLVVAPDTPTLDGEISAIARMARAAGIRPEDTVMTSTETWAAAGSRNTSLLERVQYGLGSSPPDAVVYRRSYVEFYLGAGLPFQAAPRAEALRVRTATLSRTLDGLHLSGFLILNDAQKDAVYFFRRERSDSTAVASIDPARMVPLQSVPRSREGVPGPGLDCDTQALPLCVFRER